MADVFQEDIGLVEKIYRENKNYVVWDIDSENKNCLILFSSNGLYAPNTREAFEEKIVRNDRYEFQKVTNCCRVKKRFGRLIYVRDLWRSWYVRGISQSVDTIDKLILLLAELTEGYRIVTAGISSGGFMAMAAGVRLGAACVLNFSGQFYLDVKEQHHLLGKYEEDGERNKYFDIVELIAASDTPIVYFYPINSVKDAGQAQRIADCGNVIMIAFDYAAHAQTVVPYNFKYLFDLEAKRYRKYDYKSTKKTYKSVEFLILTGGAMGFLDCVRGGIAHVRKKLKKKRFGVDF